MSDLFQEPEDATPLTVQERRELIPAHIAFRSELNQAEQENISRAQDWAMGRRRDLLSEKFIRDLHKRMLGDVWRWAGKFRTSERNLGIDHGGIPLPCANCWTTPEAGSLARHFPSTRSRCDSSIGW